MLLATVSGAFSQTEEETLVWFKDFGNSMGFMSILYAYPERFELNVSKTGIKHMTNRSDGDNKFTTNLDYSDLKYLLIKPVNEIKERKLSTGQMLYSYEFEFLEKVVYLTDCKNVGGCDKKLDFLYFSFANQENAQSVVKAINHLAKLQGAKPKPQVKKSMF